MGIWKQILNSLGIDSICGDINCQSSKKMCHFSVRYDVVWSVKMCLKPLIVKRTRNLHLHTNTNNECMRLCYFNLCDSLLHIQSQNIVEINADIEFIFVGNFEPGFTMVGLRLPHGVNFPSLVQIMISCFRSSTLIQITWTKNSNFEDRLLSDTMKKRNSNYSHWDHHK